MNILPVNSLYLDQSVFRSSILINPHLNPAAHHEVNPAFIHHTTFVTATRLSNTLVSGNFFKFCIYEVGQHRAKDMIPQAQTLQTVQTHRHPSQCETKPFGRDSIITTTQRRHTLLPPKTRFVILKVLQTPSLPATNARPCTPAPREPCDAAISHIAPS